MKKDACFRAALSYLDRGWAALALCPPDHRGVPGFHPTFCLHPGKRPLGRWKGWQSRLPTLEELSGQWEAVPRSNVGVVMGRVSGLVGIDVDGPEGERLLQDASGEEGIPGTLAFMTARGFRLLYAFDPDTTVRSWSIHQEASELKVLGEGSLTVMPPSRHATGKTYRWVRGRRPLAEAPGWVFRKPRTPGRHPAQSEGIGTQTVCGLIPKGRRNETLFRIACAMRGRGMTVEEILAALQIENCKCRPFLEPSELRMIARSACRYPLQAGCHGE